MRSKGVGVQLVCRVTSAEVISYRYLTAFKSEPTESFVDTKSTGERPILSRKIFSKSLVDRGEKDCIHLKREI